MNDPRAPESWNLQAAAGQGDLLSREPEVDQFLTFWRLYHHLAARSTAWSRKGTIVLHYRPTP